MPPGPETLSLQAVLEAYPGAEAVPVPMPLGRPSPAVMYKVMAKVFAILNTRGDQAVILKHDPHLGEILREQYAGIGDHRTHLSRNWMRVALDADVPAEEVERLVASSYALVCAGLTKKQKAELAGLSGTADWGLESPYKHGKTATTRMLDIAALSNAYDVMGADFEHTWLQENSKGSHYSSQFLDEGYFVQAIPVELVESLRGFFTDDIALPFSAADARPDYWASDLDENTVVGLNRESTYYGQPAPSATAAIEEMLASMSEEIERQLAHCWTVVNVRAWTAKPGGEGGPNSWHSDGFARYVRKIMVYVNSPNVENGTVELITRKGKTFVVEAATPVCVLFDSAVLKHRGLPGVRQGRPAIEITLAPAAYTSTDYVYAGQNARYPTELFGRAPPEVEPGTNPVFYGSLRADEDHNNAGKLNIGGGPNFRHSGWLNLDGVQSRRNPFPFIFTSTSMFPIPSSSIELVYSSHCLEHLDDATVDQALREARRVISRDGMLLLKLPDFEYTRDRWRAGDHSFFEHWGFDGVNHTWPSRNVADGLDARAAMIFCGFWNSAYGDHFSGAIQANGDAYHGPPPQAVPVLKELMELGSPHAVAKAMCDMVRKNEASFTFNHQNAWAKSELKILLDRAGFGVVSFDKNDLVERYATVPEILAMFEGSIYCLAVPV